MNIPKNPPLASAFSVLFANGQNICFQGKVHSEPIFFKYPFATVPLHLQYFVLNPFKEGSKSRNSENVELRQGITIEQDFCSLDLQRKWFQDVLGFPTVAVFSGGKSVHNHNIFEPMSAEQEKELVTLHKKLFPFADWSVITDRAKLCRAPGATRDNGKEQTVESIGEKKKIADMLSLLREKTKHIQAIAERANNFCKAYGKNPQIFDSQDKILSGFKEGGKNYLGLIDAVKDLLSCGYTLKPDTFEYMALAEREPLCSVLSLAMETANADMAKATIVKQKTQKTPTRAFQGNTGADNQDFRDWVGERLRGISREDFLSIIERYKGPIAKKNQRANGTLSICCPFHNDKNPSAFIGENHGIERLYCRTCGFKGKDAIQILVDEGRSFGDACFELFGEKYTQKQPAPIFEEPEQEHKEQKCESILPEIKIASATLEEAFSGWTGQKLIILEPGGGKTRGALKKELEAIQADIPFVYVANNTDDLDQAGKELEKIISDEHLPTELTKTIKILKGGRTKDFDGELLENKQTGKMENPKFINTHKTFIERKGIGECFYALLNTVKKERPFMVIDEINELIESNIKMIPLETIARKLKPKGAKHTKLCAYEECPGFPNTFRCDKCIPFRNLEFDVNQYSNAELTIKSCKEFEAKDIKLDFEILEIPIEVPECNFTIHYLNPNTTFLQEAIKQSVKVDYEEGEIFESQKNLEHAINSSFAAAIIEIYPTIDNVRVDITKLDQLTDSQKAKIKMPAHSCGKYLLLADRFGLRYIAEYVRGVILLTCKENPLAIFMLQICFPKLEIIRVTRNVEKLDSVFLIGYSKQASTCDAAETFTKKVKVHTIQFEPNEKMAKTVFARVWKKYPVGLAVSSRASVDKHQKFALEPLNYIIANSFGNLGKAVNLCEFASAIVNAAIYKPFIAYPHEHSREKIIASILRYRLEMVIQNYSRELRGRGRKFILVHNISKKDFEELVTLANLGSITDDLHIRYVEHEEGLIYETAVEYLNTGKIVTREEKKLELKKEKQSRKQRELNKDAIQEAKEKKQDAKFQALLEEAKTAAKTGIPWRMFYHQKNLGRVEKEKIELLQSIFMETNK